MRRALTCGEKKIGVTAAVLAAAFPCLLSATMMVELTLPELVAGSEKIVLCKVESARSYWGPEHKRIYTEYEVKVLQDVKQGSEARLLKVRKIGGEIDGIGMAVPGSGRIQVGERYLLFLKKISAGNNVYVTKGMAQGIYKVMRGRDGKVYAKRALDGTGLVRNRNVESGDEKQVAPYMIELDKFVRLIRRLSTSTGFEYEIEKGRTE